MNLRSLLNSYPARFGASNRSSHYLTAPPVAVEECNSFRSVQENKLYRRLSQRGKHILLYGQGGTGKTYMARKLFYRLSQVYARLAWVEYGTDMRSALISSFFGFDDESNLDVRFSKIIRKLTEDPQNTILFIDDAKENAISDDVLARITGLGITVFITSRCEEIPPYETYRIESISAKDCVELFYSNYPYDKKRKYIKTVFKLTELLNYNVFAVLLLARVIGKEQNLESHARKLSAQLRSIQETSNEPTEHIGRLLSLAKLSHAEKRILQCFALMPSGETSPQISQWFGFPHERLDSLVDKGWLILNKVTSGYSLHDLIREYFQNAGLPNEIVSRFLFYVMEDGFIAEDNSDETINHKIKIIEHVLQFARKESMIFAITALRLGNFYQEQNQHMQALHHYEESLESTKLLSNVSPSLLANIHWNLGMVHDSIGLFEKALYYYRNAEGIINSADNPDSQTLAGLKNNIANVYYHQCNYTEAIAHHTEAILIRERTLGINNPDTANSYSNIARVYCDIGEYAKSLEYYSKALDIRLQILGHNCPEVASSYNDIGNVHCDLGDYLKAHDYYIKALSIHKQLGNEHPLRMATSYNNLGGCCERLGDYSKSLEYHKKSINIKEQVLGYSHPDTASSYSNIGNTYDGIGDYAEALKYKTKALSIMEQVRGKQHPDTAYAYNNVGCSYLDADKYDEALDYLYKAKAIAESVLGSSHPVVADILDNIGEALCKKNDCAKALACHCEALNIRLETPSLNAVKLAESYFCLSNDYYGMKQHGKALEHGLKALEIQCEKLPPNHPNIAQTNFHLGDVYDKLGQTEKALDCGANALIVIEERFGKVHPKYQKALITVLPRFYSCYPNGDFDTWIETKKQQ